MKMSLTYFYNVRFFHSWQVPLSTACYDPKWFHSNNGNHFVYIDKRGVLNGLRAEKLHPGKTCHQLCNGRDNCDNLNPDSCRFLTEYRKQIFGINREKFMSDLRILETRLKCQLKTDHEIEFVLLVHEKPDNPCSERKVLLDFFRCSEWVKP